MEGKSDNKKSPSTHEMSVFIGFRWGAMIAWYGNKRGEGARSSLLHLGSALAHLETRIALANHVDTAAAANYFAVFATVFQASN